MLADHALLARQHDLKMIKLTVYLVYKSSHFMCFFNTLVRPCASSPCVNGGKCTNLKKSFRCECPAGYKGKRCQIQGKYYFASHDASLISICLSQ